MELASSAKVQHDSEFRGSSGPRRQVTATFTLLRYFFKRSTLFSMCNDIHNGMMESETVEVAASHPYGSFRFRFRINSGVTSS